MMVKNLSVLLSKRFSFLALVMIFITVITVTVAVGLLLLRLPLTLRRREYLSSILHLRDLTLVMLVHLQQLLLLLGSQAADWFVEKLFSFLFHLDVHQVHFLELEITVCKPTVQIVHHHLLKSFKFVNGWVDVSKEKGHFELTFIELEVRVEQGEDAPADHVVSVDGLTLKEHQLEEKNVRRLRCRWNQHADVLVKVDVIVLSSSVEAYVTTVRLLQINLHILGVVDWLRDVDPRDLQLLRAIQLESIRHLRLLILLLTWLVEGLACLLGCHKLGRAVISFRLHLTILSVQEGTFLLSERSEILR